MPNSNKQDQPEFQKIQHAFTAAIRSPHKNKAPTDVAPERFRIYQELFFNNIDSTLQQGFPVLHQTLNGDAWGELVRDYFENHQAQQPIFYEIPREFLDFLQNERDNDNDPPFLLELAHYEWVELALSLSPEEISFSGVHSDGNLLSGSPVISPLAWLIQYDFPVHEISSEYQPDEPGDTPTFLIVYRDRNDIIGFMVVNPMTAELMTKLRQQPALTGRAALDEIAEQIEYPDPQSLIDGGLKILEDLRDNDIVLGVRTQSTDVTI